MLDKYIYMLFDEYKKATGYDYTLEYMKDDFYAWLKDRKKSYKLLADLYMNITDDDYAKSSCIAEIGKGKYDTVLPELRHIYDGRLIEVTSFKESFSNLKGIRIYNGTLKIINDQVYIAYDKDFMKRPNCSYIYNNQIDTLVTQLPISNMHPFVKLFDSHKTILIGKSGLKKDLDSKNNIEYLSSLSNSFASSVSNRCIKYDYKEDDKYYASCVKVYTKK